MHRLHSLTHLVTQPSPEHLLELLAVAIAVGAFLYVFVHVRIVTLITIGIALEVFSGNWKYIPFPLPLDRIMLALSFGLLFWRGTRSVSDRRLVFKPIHFLLLGIAGYVFVNGLWAGTVVHSYGIYTWLDRLGVIPFLMFTFAPILFGTSRQREVLLIGMTVLGLYLGVTAAAEMLKVNALVLPHYINNPAVGDQAGRARGPFAESDAMGLGLFDCATFAALAAHHWRGYWARRLCVAVVVIDAFGIFFTLTRAPWIGAIAGGVAAMIWHPTLRKKLPLVIGAGIVAIGAAYFTVPGLSAKVTGRVDTTRSVWDRYNTNAAALRAIEAHPLFGIGWQTFETKGIDYMQESEAYPLTGEGIEVHNVFLSHFAELGILAGLVWAFALFATVGGAIVRRGPPELWVWRIALLAMFLMFLIEANLAPLSYPFPNLVIWLMAGIISMERYSEPRSGILESMISSESGVLVPA